MRTHRPFTVLMSAATLAVFVHSGIAQEPDRAVWLAVTTPALAPAVKPLADRRRRGGFEAIVSTRKPLTAIADLKRRPSFILLVGDDQSGKQTQPWYLPAPRRRLYRWRAVQRKQFAADALLGDTDGDLVPDVPVGRIPARTAAQVKLVVAAILAFEARQPGPDDLRLPVWAGSPGYNPAIDSMATGLLLSLTRTNAPAWAGLWIISANPRHPLCGWPPDHGTLFTKQMARGGAMAVMMGHASARSFHSMDFGGRGVWYTAADARGILVGGRPAAPLVIFSCDCGNFAAEDGCLAESLLLMSGGPPAVIAATTESHPLTNALSSLCLLQALGGTDRRLGDLWLGAQRRAMKLRNFLLERVLRDVEGKLEENINVEKLRRDQILMYALLGDPAMRLHLPERLHGKIRYARGTWHWQVRRPKDAVKLHVGLRAADRRFPAAAHPLEKADARKRFGQANDVFAFKPLQELQATTPWRGTIDTEGTLRLVATGAGKIYAATISLKPPTSQPAPAGAETKPAGR